MADRSRLALRRIKSGRRRRLFFERLEDRRLLSLTHLYTFNDGLTNDWIGSAHATALNGATVVDGQLVLNNVGITSGQTTQVQHARLGPNILGDGDATVQVWFTSIAPANWARVFDIGSQASGVGTSYLAFTPQSSFNDTRAIFLASG
ncbi:MAG TPA: hypothetical protein PKA83_20030, partial [Pirellulaceae bacterium]|nr:hypothetical protein [Pirellulaceae bacterium]